MMRIATFNANSIRARLPMVLDWLARFRPDVLCLQETKVQDKDFPAESFLEAGFNAVFRGQKSYNGVAVISKLPLVEVSLNLKREGDQEARLIGAKISDMALINVYVPQGFSPETEKFVYKLRWMKDLLFLLQRDYDPHQPLLVAGDFNVALEPNDVYDPEGLRGQVGFHPDEQAMMREILDWGLVDVFRKHEPGGGHYTFWDYRIPKGFKRNMGWRIDYILATRPVVERSQKAWIDRECRALGKSSDHTFLVAEFDINL